MDERDEFYFSSFEHRPLTPEQMDRLQRAAAQLAKEARAQALRSLFGGVVRSLRAVAGAGWDMIGRWWTAYAAWRERRQAVAELGALDDRALKDFGLHRSEIESAVYGRDSRQAAEGKVAAVLFHKPYTRRSSNVTPEHKRGTTDRAAAA
jgi:uncharacterized protein YjiS (DUF1127 family)